MADLSNVQLYGFNGSDKLFPIVEVEDNLTSTSTSVPLSANQGRVLKELIETSVADVASALVLRGEAPSDEFTAALTDHNVGDTFVVTSAGTYVGQTCNAGDFIICKTTGTSSNDDDWFVVESNQPNVVTCSESSVSDAEVPIFSGTSGKVLGSSDISVNDVLLISGTTLQQRGSTGSVSDITSAKVSGIKDQLGITSVETNLTTIQTQVSSLSDSLSTVSTAVETAQSDISDLKEQIEELETSTDVTTLTSRVSALESTLSTVQSTVTSLQSTVDTISTNVSTLQTSVSTINNSISSLETKLSTAEGNIDTLESSVDTLESTVSTLSSTVSTLNTTVTSIQSSVTTMSSTLSTLETSVSELESAVEAVTPPTGYQFVVVANS